MKQFLVSMVLLCIVTLAGAEEQPCSMTATRKVAATLESHCLQVSAASHPPCAAKYNSCTMIREEIVRSCADSEGTKFYVKFCDGYKQFCH